MGGTGPERRSPSFQRLGASLGAGAICLRQPTLLCLIIFMSTNSGFIRPLFPHLEENTPPLRRPPLSSFAEAPFFSFFFSENATPIATVVQKK